MSDFTLPTVGTEIFSAASSVLDVNSINSLKAKSATNSPEVNKKIASEVEGLFIQMMIKSMRDAIPKDGLFNSNQTELFMSLYDQQISQELGKEGIGFADQLISSMETNSLFTEPEENAGKMFSLADTVNPMSLMTESSKIDPSTMLQVLKNSLDKKNVSNLTTKIINSPVNISNKVENFIEGASEFINRLTTPAKLASQDTGIHHHLILAQAALESGWGKHEIQTLDGQKSHNLFGIKAGKNWSGNTADVLTTEYVNGKEIKVRAKFRAYESYQHALSDYVDLLTNNPRYEKVLSAKSPEQAAIEIQKAGYATDPRYADKLINIIQKFKVDNSTANRQAAKSYVDVSNIKI